MMILVKSFYFWSIFLLGLIHIHSKCEARAVNVSNTWTMPQEGLNVFYRFFRDRISWFEADAVCQFHHANLVTVDNSFQFDATRDLLRELDVNDIVWIGLIRPQSSERFMWSNSRPLVADTGYWAESLPLMEAPLCAVIDPIRDYRWHALRCGGPETASFLCEMAVPTWADVCIFKDIPDLTMQYMADTASVELIRTCQEEGTLRQTCKGKQDRERIKRELVCPRERMEAKRINDITNSHFKSLKIIKNTHTDNNENNDIELVPISVANYDTSGDVMDTPQPTEKNTVQRLIEQFNVDELMQADQPVGADGFTEFHIPGEIPKPVKKIAKKYAAAIELNRKKPQPSAVKKDNEDNNDNVKPAAFALEDMMLGDQPQGEPELVEHVLEDEESNDILEPLPHQKKILSQDLKSLSTEKLEKPLATTTTTTMSQLKENYELDFTTMSENLYASEEFTTNMPKTMDINYHDESSILTGIIGHPIHPQQTHMMNINLDAYPHIKETVVDNSHFIPPMLMVKSHYVPSTKHEHVEYSEQLEPVERPEHHVHLHALPATTTSTTTSTTTPTATTASTSAIEMVISSTTMPSTTTTIYGESNTKIQLNDLPITTGATTEKIFEFDADDKMSISRDMSNNITASTTQSPVILSSTTATDMSNVGKEITESSTPFTLSASSTMNLEMREKNIAENVEQQMRFERTSSKIPTTITTTTTKPINIIENENQKKIYDSIEKMNKSEQQIIITTSSLPMKIPTTVSTTTATTTTTEVSPTKQNEVISRENLKESMTTSSSTSLSEAAGAAASVAQLMSTTEIPDLRVSTATKLISSKSTPTTTTTTAIEGTIKPVNHDVEMMGGNGEGTKVEAEIEENFEEEKYDKMILAASAKNTEKAEEFEAKVAAAFAAASNVGQLQQQQQPLDVKTTEASAHTITTTTTTKATTTTDANQLISSSASELPTFLFTEGKQEKIIHPITATSTTAQPIVTTTTTATSAKITTPFVNNNHDKHQQQQQQQHVKETAETKLIIEKTNNNNNKKENNKESGLPSTLEGIIKMSTTPVIFTTIPTTTTTTETATAKQGEEILGTSTYRNFYVEDTTVQFRPNRKRMLTKPESVSYFKKILG